MKLHEATLRQIIMEGIDKEIPYEGMKSSDVMNAVSRIFEGIALYLRPVKRQISAVDEFRKVLRDCIEKQAAGEWDDRLIETDLRYFLERLSPFLHTKEPVSLEECAMAALRQSAPSRNGYWDGERAKAIEMAKAVLDAAKAQGARFDYVDK